MKQDIFDTNPIVSTIICSIIGIALIGDFTAQEQNVLGNWLMLIAQELITNASSQNLIQSRANPPVNNINSKEIKNIYNPIIYDTNILKDILDKMYPKEIEHTINLLKKAIEKMSKEIDEIKASRE